MDAGSFNFQEVCMNRRSRAKREELSIDFSLRPVMSLMVTLVPILLFSAEFCKVSIVQADASGRGSNTNVIEKENCEKPKIPVLAISDSSLTIIGAGNQMRSILFTKVRGKDAFDDDQYVLNETKTDLFEEVELILKTMQESNERKIVVSSDAKVKYAAIISLMDSAMRAGFTDVSIARLRT